MGFFNGNKDLEMMQQNARNRRREKENSNEENWRRVLLNREEDQAPKKSSFERMYEMLRKDILDQMGIDIDIELHLPDYEEVEKILRVRKRVLDRTSFNQNAFPEGTEILYFDDVFNEIYSSPSDYYADRGALSSRIQSYIKNNGYENVCIKIGVEEFLFFYPNCADDSVYGKPYNVSLTDKDNVVKRKIIYEEDGETCGDIKNLQQILEIQVEFLDLSADEKPHEIGDVSPERYTSYELSPFERLHIKRDILLDIYESGLFIKGQYEVIRAALCKDIDIGYILYPGYDQYQMRAILKYLGDYRNNPQFLANLRKFSSDIGRNFKKPFGDCEFLYVMTKCLNGRMDDWTSPTTIAEMKINNYKDIAWGADANEAQFSIDGHCFILTKNHDKHPRLEDFKLEEAIYNKGNTVGRKFVYECNESGIQGSLDEVMNLLIKKCQGNDNAEILSKAIEDAKKANIDSAGQGGCRVLFCEDGARITITGFDKENAGDTLMASFFGGAATGSAEENTGITVTILKNGAEQIVYSDDENLGITTTMQELQEIVDKHGKLQKSMKLGELM